MSMARRNGQGSTEGKKYLFFLAYSALGVVYGDIGTSPLYALRACFHGSHSVEQTSANVLGVLSLIFWSLILIISLKYLLLILRADNQGEGGILALMELVLPEKGLQKTGVLILGFFGAALLYGDGTITPAISVLSAIEGLEIATPIFKPYIIPITIGILFFLFLVQQRGTGKVGLRFGPVMLIWFVVIAITGTSAIIKNPAVLASLNPWHAFRFFQAQGFESLYILGAVFLVVTGGEALYADIGHFGRTPIRLAWFTVVLPCLLLNYFGQGALILDHRAYASNPFYYLAPNWALYPMVVLAAAATIIASQAIIAGVFSLTFQAVQLGYLPRLQIQHTSEEEKGQIYMPQINWAMFIATTAVVLGFQSSSNLAGAYGVAVSTTMVITSILSYVAMRDLWSWPKPAAICIVVALLSIDFSFFSANMLKILHGGWYPLLAGGMVYLLMSTWAKGQEIIGRQLKEYVQPLKNFVKNIDYRTVKKVSGTAVYLTQSPLSTPAAFVQNIKHNKVVHRRVIFLSIGFGSVPYIRAEDRVYFKRLSEGFYRVLVRYGFMNRVDMQAVIRIIQNKHIKIDREDTTFFVGRGSLIPTRSVGMSKWRDRLFIIMNRNAERATKYFNLPPDQVLEIGVQIKF
jgi:KUP system potassium uptake protein